MELKNYKFTPENYRKLKVKLILFIYAREGISKNPDLFKPLEIDYKK